MAVILRRRKLGRTSCREISRLMKQPSYVFRNDRPAARIALALNEIGFTFRWGTTSNLPVEGTTVVNTAEAIHRVNDKLEFRRLLNEKGLCPQSYFHEVDVSWPADGRGFIIRPRQHAQGRQLYHVHTDEELVDVIDRLGSNNYYISEYIPKVAEYRVFVAQGRAVWVAQKTPGNPEDIAWNVDKGGRFDNVRWDDWPLKVVKTAIEAFNLSGLDFGGVDVMVGPDGSVYVLEINSAPSQTSPYRQSCVAKVFDYIIENGKQSIPLIEDRGNYRKFIHPAVCERAILGE